MRPPTCSQFSVILTHMLGHRILRTDGIRTRLISILMGATMQRLEVVRGHSEFLSHFSIPQENPTQPETTTVLVHLASAPAGARARARPCSGRLRLMRSILPLWLQFIKLVTKNEVLDKSNPPTTDPVSLSNSRFVPISNPCALPPS